MWNAVITAVFLGTMLFDGAVLQKDCIFKGRINIRSKTGELKRWMKKDLLLPNRVNVYDKYGNMKGFLVKDILSGGTGSSTKAGNPTSLFASCLKSRPLWDAPQVYPVKFRRTAKRI